MSSRSRSAAISSSWTGAGSPQVPYSFWVVRQTGRRPRLSTASQAATATPGVCSLRKSSRTTMPSGASSDRAAPMSPSTCSYRWEASTWTKRQVPGATSSTIAELGAWTIVGRVSWKDR